MLFSKSCLLHFGGEAYSLLGKCVCSPSWAV